MNDLSTGSRGLLVLLTLAFTGLAWSCGKAEFRGLSRDRSPAADSDAKGQPATPAAPAPVADGSPAPAGATPPADPPGTPTAEPCAPKPDRQLASMKLEHDRIVGGKLRIVGDGPAMHVTIKGTGGEREIQIEDGQEPAVIVSCVTELEVVGTDGGDSMIFREPAVKGIGQLKAYGGAGDDVFDLSGGIGYGGVSVDGGD